MPDEVRNLPARWEDPDDAEWAEILEEGDDLSPIDEVPAIILGHYYQYTGDSPVGPQGEIPPKEFVFPTDFGDEHVRVTCRSNSIRLQIQFFYDNFRYAPEAGEAARRQEMQEIVKDGEEDKKQFARIAQKMRDMDPYRLIAAAPTVEQMKAGTGTDIVQQTPEGAKNQVRLFRNSALKFEARMRDRADKINALATEEKSRVEAIISAQKGNLMVQVEQMKNLLKVAEEAIWSIELYLGRKEEIVVIQEGNPAPATDKIYLRQGLLYMDEECAVAAEDGGIDFKDIEKFDEWLKNPAHLQQVLPESRGVVAFKVRYSDKQYTKEKDYASLLMQSQMNENNKVTYFLMRNGENLYRIHTSLDVGSRLFPHMEEFENIFYVLTTDYSDPDYPLVRKRLEPGSHEYVKAMETAEAKQKHYMRVFLFLQGLLDRTPIFHPLPVPKVNILDVEKQDNYLQFIYDSEPGKLLTTQHPTFDQWQKTLNNNLRKGHRIIGTWSTYGAWGRYDRDELRGRVHPPNAGLPPSLRLYTIEDVTDAGEFVIRFERDDEIWVDTRWGWEKRPPKMRASVRFKASDTFILNFDEASIEDMEYYLKSRVSRRSYVYMFPVLKNAIELKRLEKEEEAPFRLLLIGEIMKAHGVDREDAEAQVDELITWWKFKNYTHRALSSDDRLATEQIVAEFGARKAKREWAEKYDFDNVRAEVLEAEPTTMFLAHMQYNEFVAYVPQEKPAFCKVQVWRSARGKVYMAREEEWHVIKKEHLKYTEVLHQTEEWEAWPKEQKPTDFITGPEREQIVEGVWKQIASKVEGWRSRSYRVWRTSEKPTKHPADVFLPVAVTMNAKHEVFAWYYDTLPWTPPENEILTGTFVKDPHISRVQVSWEKKSRSGFTWRVGSYSHSHLDGQYFTEEGVATKDRFGYVSNHTLLWFDPEPVRTFNEARQQVKAAESRRTELRKKVTSIVEVVRDEMRERIYQKHFLAFMEEYGDIELWPAHREKIKVEVQYPNGLERAVSILVQNGVSACGLSVEQVRTQAQALGYKDGEPEHSDWRSAKLTFEGLPMDFVIPESACPPDAPTQGDPAEEDYDD